MREGDSRFHQSIVRAGIAVALGVVLMMSSGLWADTTSSGPVSPSSDRPFSVGLLPLNANDNDEQIATLRHVVDGMIDIEAAQLPNVDLVERGRINKILEELTSSKIGRKDLQTGQIVGAEILLASTLSREGNDLILVLSALETATGNVLLQKRTALAGESSVKLGVHAFMQDLPGKLVRKPHAVDVVILSITHTSPFPAKDGVVEDLRLRFMKRLEAIPGVRVLNRELGQFVLGESQLAAGGLVDPKRRFAPVAGAVVVQGNLDQQIITGQTIEQSVLTLELKVRSDRTEKTIKASGILAKAEEMELSASRELCSIIAEMAGVVNKAEISIDDGDIRYWEAQKYMATARSMINRINTDDPKNKTACDLVIKAANLIPESPDPYAEALALGLDHWFGGPLITAVRRRFIEGFPKHPSWHRAVQLEQLELLGAQLGGSLLTNHMEIMIGTFGKDNYQQALTLAVRLADAIVNEQNKPAESQEVMPTIRLLLLDGQYNKALQMCAALSNEPFFPSVTEAYVIFAIDIGQLDWARKAAEIRQKHHPDVALDSYLLKRNGRSEKIKASADYERWQPILNIVRKTDLQAAQAEAAGRLPSWGETCLVDKQYITGLTTSSIPRGITMSISPQGDSLLAILRDSGHYLLWRFRDDKAVELTGLPPLIPPGQIMGYVMRPSIATFEDKVYIGAEEHGLFAADPISGKTSRVAKGFPDGSVHALIVVGKSLYAAGGGKDAGFVACREAGKPSWTIWMAPRSCGQVRRVMPRNDGSWRIYHDGTQRLSLFEPETGRWDEGFSVEEYAFSADFTAGMSSLALLLQSGGDTQHPMCLFNEKDKVMLSVYFPPAELSGLSSILQRHEVFWSWNKHPDATVAPLADHPVDAATADGWFWILDASGGLTATPDGRSFAGPFMVAPDGQAMCITKDAICVASRRSVVAVPRKKMTEMLNQSGAFHTSQDVIAGVMKRLKNWIQSQPVDERIGYFNRIGRPDLAEVMRK